MELIKQFAGKLSGLGVDSADICWIVDFARRGDWYGVRLACAMTESHYRDCLAYRSIKRELDCIALVAASH